MVEVFQNVLHNLCDTLRRTQCFLGINSGNLFVLLFILLLDRVNIVDAERQHISIIDCIHNSVGMELRTKSLLCGSEIRISTCSGIDCENRCASKSKDMIVLEILFHLDCLFALFDLPSDNSGVHVSKLAAVALVKHKNNMLVTDRVARIFVNEHIQFLNGRYDNSGSAVLKLSLQNCCTLVSVGSTFLKAIIFLDGLVVQVLTVNHKQNLFDIRQVRSKLGSLKGSQGLAASCGVPDISSGFDSACFLVVGGHFNSVQNTFGSNNLIGARDKQQFFGCEHAVFCQDIQNGVLRKECLCEIHKVGNDLVIAVCPIGSELKAVGSFLAVLLGGIFTFLNVACSGGIGIILCECAVGDNENLHILIKPTTSPEAITLITVDLVERFLDSNATAFQLHMNQRQTVHKNGHIISGVVRSGTFLILIDDLQTVVVDILLVNQRDVHRRAVLTGQILNIVLLNFSGLFHDTLIGIGNLAFEKAVPFLIRKLIVIEYF